MDLGKLPLFQMMSQRLAWLGKRQQVLAQNVANADTPGYRAHDLKEPTFRELVGGPGAVGGGRAVQVARTRPSHLVGFAQASAGYKTEEDTEGEFSLSGNSVDLESQMMKVARTAMDHQMTVNLYRKHISMLKAALGRPSG